MLACSYSSLQPRGSHECTARQDGASGRLWPSCSDGARSPPDGLATSLDISLGCEAGVFAIWYDGGGWLEVSGMTVALVVMCGRALWSLPRVWCACDPCLEVGWFRCLESTGHDGRAPGPAALLHQVGFER